MADLITEVPTAGGLASRCKPYLCNEDVKPDVVIREEMYRPHRYGPDVSEDMLAYLEAAHQFYLALIDHGGLYLHSSAVVKDGMAYLFSGPCGTGKSTHTRIWRETFGGDTRVINDDKPAIRRIDGRWYAYGTPWCGKDGININEKVPLAGVCFLKQAKENKIRRLSQMEAMQKFLTQTIYKHRDVKRLDKMLCTLDLFLREIPVYELENLPVSDAARLSYETMCNGAKEAGL